MRSAPLGRLLSAARKSNFHPTATTIRRRATFFQPGFSGLPARREEGHVPTDHVPYDPRPPEDRREALAESAARERWRGARAPGTRAAIPARGSYPARHEARRPPRVRARRLGRGATATRARRADPPLRRRRRRARRRL